MTARPLVVLVLFAFTFPAVAQVQPPRANAQAYVPMETRPVDVVIALDTSGSMEGLLDSVRARLWDIVNELAKLRPTPELRIGLVQYGTESSTAEAGWIAVEGDLSDDLDEVYGRLMALTIGGGEEYVGWAVQTALDEMSWSRDLDALRVIFIAGNESADQAADEVNFRHAASEAVNRDIIVNALYAGNREQAVVEQWPELARRGLGNFSAIDPQTSTVQIATPQDDVLRELNLRLNSTYVPYGPRGAVGLANQIAQDSNASRLGVQSCGSRIVAKGSALYTNASWDLVDRALEEDFSWDALDPDDLPETMHAMTPDERVAYVESKRADREAIQLEIQEASHERESHIRSVLLREQRALGLDDAVREAICNQAKAKGFSSDDC